jgi:YHS domain-containing protein
MALCLIASSASGQAKPKSAQKAPTQIACAVMTASKVNIKDATKKKMFADYKGRRYFFCCDGCPQAFKKDPAKYAKAPSIKTPKG